MFQILAYIRFLLKSTNQHGVHSPFVFDLITKCFYKKKQRTVYSKLEQYRVELLNNKNHINVTDFGAGSRVFKSNKRKISAIAKTAGITTKRAKLLTRLASYFNFNNCLELGTSLGLATSAIAFGNSKTKITQLLIHLIFSLILASFFYFINIMNHTFIKACLSYFYKICFIFKFRNSFCT